MEKSNSYDFLEKVPKFKKFLLKTDHEPKEKTAETALSQYHLSIEASNEEKKIIFYKDKENSISIEFSYLNNEIEITGCTFSKEQCQGLLDNALQEASQKGGWEKKPIKVSLSPFDFEAARFFLGAHFALPVEYIINKRLKMKNGQISLYYRKTELPTENNVSFEAYTGQEETIDTNFIENLIAAKRLFYENKNHLLFLDSDIKNKSEGNEAKYEELWKDFINNYYLDTRTIEQCISTKESHKIIASYNLSENIFAEYLERNITNPTTKGSLINGTFFIKDREKNNKVEGYANIRFFPEESKMFLNLVFFNNSIKLKNLFTTFYKTSKDMLLKKYKVKEVYFYTTKDNTHTKFWESEGFKIEETTTPGKIKLVHMVNKEYPKE